MAMINELEIFFPVTVCSLWWKHVSEEDTASIFSVKTYGIRNIYGLIGNLEGHLYVVLRNFER
jgi:hypothetical protein